MSDRLTFDQISSIMAQRRGADSVLMRAMADIASRYNGAVTIPLPDVAGEPQMPLAIPNLVADAIDQNSLRAASTTPMIHCPALHPTSASINRAATRRRALYGTWDYSALQETLLPRSYRHLTGYGTNCFMVLPDFESNRARIEVRDPLTAYPEHRSPEDTREPLNCGFVFGRSRHWVEHRFPESKVAFDTWRQAYAQRSRNLRSFDDTLWDIVEWIDQDQIVMGILGPRESLETPSVGSLGMGLKLASWDNRAGMVPIAIPRRITLDRIDGQVSKLTGLVDMMGKLMALDVLAADKAVFPDFVVIDDTGQPQLLNASGKWNDGRTGEANLVKAKSVTLLQSSPGPLTHPVIDRLERNYRHSAGMPSMLGGENSNALRTGNALDAMAGIAVDPRILELQRLMTRGLKVVNEAVCEVEKGYFPGKKVFFSGWPGDRGHVTYDPAVDFDSRENAVTYAFPGTDINNLTVAVAQAVDAKLISRKMGREKHPLNENPEEDERQIFSEALEEAAMGAIVMQGNAGVLPLTDLAAIDEAFEKTGSWREAVKVAAQLAQERQATPVPADDPAAQPGLAMPGQGVEAPIQPDPAAQGMDFGALVSAMQSAPPA